MLGGRGRRAGGATACMRVVSLVGSVLVVDMQVWDMYVDVSVRGNGRGRNLLHYSMTERERFAAFQSTLLGRGVGRG